MTQFGCQIWHLWLNLSLPQRYQNWRKCDQIWQIWDISRSDPENTPIPSYIYCLKTLHLTNLVKFRQNWRFYDVQKCSQNCGQWHRNARFGSKVGQIGHKWNKSGTFSDYISVHLARIAKMYWKKSPEKSHGYLLFGPIWPTM